MTPVGHVSNVPSLGHVGNVPHGGRRYDRSSRGTSRRAAEFMQ
jgi:hypothetical protein